MANSIIINDLISKLGIDTAEFERQIVVKGTRISTAIRRNSKIKKDVVDKILIRYPNVNREWLETGVGDMFIAKKFANQTGEIPPGIPLIDGSESENDVVSSSSIKNDQDMTTQGLVNTQQDLATSLKEMALAMKDIAAANLIQARLLERRMNDDEGLKRKAS